MKIIFSLIGLFVGGSVDDFTGAFFGFFIGLLSGWLIQQSKRIRIGYATQDPAQHGGLLGRTVRSVSAFPDDG